MKEPRTFEGRWWIFGTEKPAHFGVLHYSPEKGLRLEVKIAQSFGFTEILQETDGVAFPKVIQGRDKDDKPITLFGSSSPGWNKSGGLAPYEFHPLIAIVGQSVESWTAANYHTHFDEELKGKGKIVGDIGDLVRLVSQMETLLGICILKDLGITGAPITRLIERHKKMEVFSLK